jgi:hypothetical protein
MRWSNLGLFTLAASMTLIATEPSFSQVDTTQDPNAINKDYTLQRYAVGGKKSTFAWFYSLKIDCTPTDWQEIKITKSPENGEAVLKPTMTLANYNAPNPRTKCNGKSVKSMTLEYTPNKGYVGTDSIEIESINDFGQRNTFTYNITVK